MKQSSHRDINTRSYMPYASLLNNIKYSKFPSKIKWIVSVCLVFGFLGLCESQPSFTLSDEVLNATEKKYGILAKDRLLRWQKLIRNNGGKSDKEKLELVNNFFNSKNITRYKSDIKHWKKKDYWATPIEFLQTGYGDCEDYALAKYFTLKALSVAGSKINMTYVRITRSKGKREAHMVLSYYEKPGAMPLILDNFKRQIMYANKRTDLKFVFSFNSSSLWKAKGRVKGKKNSSRKYKIWQNLLNRMPTNLK